MIGYRKSAAYRREVEANARSIWMARFENEVKKVRPDHAGKIAWDNAYYMHGTGMSYQDAAARYVSHLGAPDAS